MKKNVVLFILTCIIMALIAPITSTYATATKPDTFKIIKQELKKTDYDLDVKEVEVNMLEKYANGIYSGLEEIGFYEKLGSGYTIKTDSNATKSFIFTGTKSEEQAILTQRLYVNAEGERVFAQIIYLPETDYIGVQSSKISKDGKTVEDFYVKTNLKSLVSTSTDGMSTSASGLPSFPQWMCWMGSTLACTVYCSALGLIALPVGIVCSVVCGGMFFLACYGA